MYTTEQKTKAFSFPSVVRARRRRAFAAKVGSASDIARRVVTSFVRSSPSFFELCATNG